VGKYGKRQYTLEFKQQAVILAREIGRSSAAKQLGVNVSNLQRWEKGLKQDNLKEEKVTKISLEEENRKLRKEVEEQKKVIHILKSAAAFFSRDHLK